jgi:ABC-type multidrug transport system fused ATPase/permease subunit
MFGEDIYSEQEEAKTKGLGFKLLPRIWPFFRKYRKKVVVAGAMLVVSTVLSLFGPVLIKRAIDVDIGGGSGALARSDLLPRSGNPKSEIRNPNPEVSGFELRDSGLAALPLLARRLRAADDSLSVFLVAQFSPGLKQQISRLVVSKSEPVVDTLRKALTAELNKVLLAGPLYTEQRFAGVELPAELRKQAEAPARGAALSRLNRSLLEKAYPGAIAPFKAGSIPGLVRTAIIYLLLQLVVFAISYYQRIALAVVGENAVADLKEKLYQHIIRLPVSFFDHNPVGRLITRNESDTEALKQLFATTAVVIAQDIVMLVGMSVVMAIVNWKLFLIVIVLFPPFLFAFTWFQRKARPVYISIRRTVAEINNFINETIRGLPVVQAMNRQEYFAAKMDSLNREKFSKEMKAQFYWYRVWFMVDFGEVVGFVLVLGIGGLWALKGVLTIGSLFLFISYITRVFQPIRGLADQINVMQRAFASGERMFGIFDTQPEQADRVTRQAARVAQGLQIEGVDFAYEGRGNDAESCPHKVLKDINLNVRKGEKVALVGETGGGKTSIISLIMKFYEPQTGRILIDGIDLHELDNKSLRRQVGFVPQEVILFPGTVLDNLRLFDETVSEEKVADAARRARIHEKILQFPQGYATNLIERGINLSLGERQLLAFARALVFNPEVLILDEATSSVDPHTEHLIQEGLEELLKGRTAIIVAHRLATIQMVDRIVVVHKGRIVQEGSHAELIAEEGYYNRLYRLQYLSQENA